MCSLFGNLRKGNGGGVGWLVILCLKGMSGMLRVKDVIGNCVMLFMNLIFWMLKFIGRFFLFIGMGCLVLEGVVGEVGWFVLDEEMMCIVLGFVCEFL